MERHQVGLPIAELRRPFPEINTAFNRLDMPFPPRMALTFSYLVERTQGQSVAELAAISGHEPVIIQRFTDQSKAHAIDKYLFYREIQSQFEEANAADGQPRIERIPASIMAETRDLAVRQLVRADINISSTEVSQVLGVVIDEQRVSEEKARVELESEALRARSLIVAAAQRETVTEDKADARVPAKPARVSARVRKLEIASLVLQEMNFPWPHKDAIFMHYMRQIGIPYKDVVTAMISVGISEIEVKRALSSVKGGWGYHLSVFEKALNARINPEVEPLRQIQTANQVLDGLQLPADERRAIYYDYLSRSGMPPEQIVTQFNSSEKAVKDQIAKAKNSLRVKRFFFMQGYQEQIVPPETEPKKRRTLRRRVETDVDDARLQAILYLKLNHPKYSNEQLLNALGGRVSVSQFEVDLSWLRRNNKLKKRNLVNKEAAEIRDQILIQMREEGRLNGEIIEVLSLWFKRNIPDGTIDTAIYRLVHDGVIEERRPSKASLEKNEAAPNSQS